MSSQWASAPVMTMSPQPSHQSPFGLPGFPQQHQQATPSNNFPGSIQMPPNPYQQEPPRPSRKRSRDEAALEPEVLPPAPSNPEEGWVYGPGMTLIKPDEIYVAEASSQSGTWLEERRESEKIARRKQEEAARPVIRTAKSIRVDRSASRSPLGFAARKSPLPSGLVTPPDPNNKVPEIDNFAIQLGVGWKRISENDAIQAAARGWAKFIENHYPITNAIIRLESKAHASYLVESREGFFLFSENLRQGRLVSSNIVSAMQNIGSNPPTFEGADFIYANEGLTPPAVDRSQNVMDSDMMMD